VDGVTGTAPSENAVFDALATKLDATGTNILSTLTLSGVIDATLGLDVNDWNPTGLSNALEIRITTTGTSSAVAIRGLDGISPNRVIILSPVSGVGIRLINESLFSTASMRFLVDETTARASNNESIILKYDPTLGRWRALSSSGYISSHTATPVTGNVVGFFSRETVQDLGTPNAFIAGTINNSTHKAIPVDADRWGYWDSVSGTLDYVTWGEVRTLLNSYVSGTYLTQSAIEDSVVNGHTGIAPSGNAVYDALLLKEDKSNKGITGGYVGMHPNALAIQFPNLAGTFINNMDNSSTAIRTYTFPDKSITVAGISDIPVPASGSVVDLGTENFNYVTPLSLKDSHNVPFLSPTGVYGKVIASDNTDWIIKSAPTLEYSDPGLMTVNSAETTIFNVAIPANWLSGSNMVEYEILLKTVSTTTRLMTWKLYYDDTIMITDAINSTGANNTSHWVVRGKLLSTGSNAQLATLEKESFNNTAGTGGVSNVTSGTATEDTSSTKNIKLTCQLALSITSAVVYGITVKLLPGA
jgi:hypothetical protein